MFFATFVWFVLTALVAVPTGYLCYRVFKKWPKYRYAKIAALTFTIALTAIPAFSQLYFEFPRDTCLVGMDTQGNLHQYRYGHLESSDIVAYASMPHTDTAQSSVTVVTNNPKVRNISFSGVARLTDYAKFCGQMSPEQFAQTNMQGLMHTRVESALCEFTEHHSKELATFYNPYDSTQQEQFRAIVANYMNQSLDGIDFQPSRFKITY